MAPVKAWLPRKVGSSSQITISKELWKLQCNLSQHPRSCSAASTKAQTIQNHSGAVPTSWGPVWHQERVGTGTAFLSWAYSSPFPI